MAALVRVAVIIARSSERPLPPFMTDAASAGADFYAQQL